jgi:hypothetical protein
MCFKPDRPTTYQLRINYHPNATGINWTSSMFAGASLTDIDYTLNTHDRPIITYTVKVNRHMRKVLTARLKRAPHVEKLHWLKITG